VLLYDSTALLDELHALQPQLTLPSISEAIRLLESDKFARVTDQDVKAIANYRSVEIDDETFFQKAFSPGKEIAASLSFATYLGKSVVLEDLRRLLATATGPTVGTASGL